MGEEASNCASGKEAEFHELAKAGVGAHARCESVSTSVSLRFCTALVVESWTCESGELHFASASGSVVRVFFCCGGVNGARSAAALRVCLSSTGGPPGACAS